MHKHIKIENLKIYTEQKIIVKNINLEISTKKPLILLGESGSGKSLIMDAIMGILPKELKVTGKILLDGTDILKLSKKEREKLWGKNITLLPQEPWLSLDPTMKVINQVKEIRDYVYKDKSTQSYNRTIQELKDVKLEKFKNSYPHKLSGGMCQRLTIAVTHAQEASVILVDEPTKGLDRDLCNSILDKLNSHVKANKLLFIITHDLHIAKNIEGSLGIIVDGEIIEYSDTKNIFENPQEKYTKELISTQVQFWNIKKLQTEENIIIKIKNLSKKFGKNQLFKNLSFDIKKGEIVSIIGKSGSGKSSLGNIILGHLKSDSGQIIKNKEYSKIQFQKIYQDPPSAFLPNQILKDGLLDLLKIHNINEKELYLYLKKLNLPKELLNRKANEISGGELQRISILRVLLLKPIFIFADEITSRLDPISQKEVLLLLKTIVEKERLSVLLVTHDYAIAKILSNKTIFLEKYK